MSRPESWESVARALASRLVYHANACPVGFNPFGELDPAGYGERHRDPAEHADTCPFCADTVAYRRFRRKAHPSGTHDTPNPKEQP